MKRFFDFAVAVLGLMVSAPLLAIMMLALRLESPGPVIFAQRRIGRWGCDFTCYKLRTMYEGTGNLPSHQSQASAVTRLGRRLRKWKLDELPQLYNVLLGNMSLVGPRPCLPTQTALIDARRRQGVLEAPPGITGLAQVQGIDMSDPERLAAVDAEYVRRSSFVGDLKLLFATVFGKGLGVDRIAEQHLFD